jgi:hypothetical protein
MSIVMPRFFFLRQPIGVDGGERLDETGFPVIDMAGGANDEHYSEPVIRLTWSA